MTKMNINLQQIEEYAQINWDLEQDGWECNAANASSFTQTQEVFNMAQFALNGQSQEMKRKMHEDKYILKDIAILGQWTVIYAAPNAGKTLITLKMLIDSIESGGLNGNDIFYINADDTYKGFQQKLEIAEKYGFYMLMPGQNNFEVNKFQNYLKQMINSGVSKGKIIVLDTLKKFTNLMDKSQSSGFGVVIRDFVSSGGSVISLAHVNKHKDELGNSVHSGTSDIKDDCDCCYVVDVNNPDAILKTVIFRNEKSRGDVARKKTFQYRNENGISYLDILDSIETLSEHEAKVMHELNAINDRLKVNYPIINAVSDSIRDGIKLKTSLVEHVNKTTGISKSKIINVLEQHAGLDFSRGHRWKVTTGDKNAQTYSLLVMTESSVT